MPPSFLCLPKFLLLIFCQHLWLSSIFFSKISRPIINSFKSYRFYLLPKFPDYFILSVGMKKIQSKNFILSENYYGLKSIANSSYDLLFELNRMLCMIFLVQNFVCVYVWTRANDSKYDNCLAESF